MKTLMQSWQFWALASSGFAALTAIFGKIGVANIGSDFATLIRTVVILAVIGAIVGFGGDWRLLASVSGKTYQFLALSGVATGASWLCYYGRVEDG